MIGQGRQLWREMWWRREKIRWRGDYYGRRFSDDYFSGLGSRDDGSDNFQYERMVIIRLSVRGLGWGRVVIFN